MKSKHLFKNLLVAAALLSAVDAAVASVTSTINAGIRGTQQGRLSRNGLVNQDWSGSEAYPGFINPTVTYFYSTFLVNVGSTNYLEIDMDSLSANTFVAAYQTSYDPSSPGTTWLGDAATSGDSFGTNVLTFQVVGGLNSFVTIVVNNTGVSGLGVADPFTLSVLGSTADQAANGIEGVALAVTRVPEPSTLLLLLAPLGLVAGRKLRGRRSTMGALAAA